MPTTVTSTLTTRPARYVETDCRMDDFAALIDQATDLQLNVPNVSYTKTNFTGSNFQIRGIGVSSVAASGDSGVETPAVVSVCAPP